MFGEDINSLACSFLFSAIVGTLDAFTCRRSGERQARSTFPHSILEAPSSGAGLERRQRKGRTV